MKSREKSKNPSKQMKMRKKKNQKSVGPSKSRSKRKIHSIIILPQESRKSQINNQTLHLKELEKKNKQSPN